MRTKQAFKNAFMSLLLEAVLALSGILIPRFFIALYGSPVNGLVSSINQFITYMGLVEAGIGAAGTVALYRPLAEKKTEEINGIVSAARSFYLRSGLIFLLLAAALVGLYPRAVQNEIQDVSFIRVMILVLSVNGIVDYFYLGKYRVLLLADQRGYVISLAQIAGTVVMTGVCIGLMVLECSALAVKGTTAAIYLLRSAAVGMYVRRHYPEINFRAKPNFGAFQQRWDALIHQIAGMVVNNTDLVLLTLLLPQGALAEVSVYSIYSLVSYTLSSLMNALSSGIRSSFGQVISTGEQTALRNSYSTFEYAFFYIIFVAYSCMAVLLHPFIRLYCASFPDSASYSRWSLVLLFTVIGLVQSVRIPGSTIACAAGHYKQTRWRAIAEAVINLTVSIALVRPFGICGVLIGTLASYAYRSADVIFYNAKHFLPGTLKRTGLRLLRNLVVSAALVAGGLALIPQTMAHWGGWLAYAVLFGAISCAVLLLVNWLFEPEQVKAMIRRFKGIAARYSGRA